MNQKTNLQQELAKARDRFAARNPCSLAQHLEASKVMPGGSTRGSIWFAPFPVVISEGYGARLKSLDGDEYVDFLGEYTVAIAGHSPEPLLQAVRDQLARGWSYGAHSQQEQRAASAVCRRFPAIESVRFTNSGTEANLLAMSLARAVTGREKVVVFKGGYHGSVFAFGNTPQTLNAPFPFIVAPYNNLAATLDLIGDDGHNIAAVFVELMQGSGGCFPANAEFISGLRAWTQSAGALLVVDEVMTSRIGPAGLSAFRDLQPDLVTLGKYIGGGFSFGAVGGKAALMQRFDLSRPGALVHAGTFNNNLFTMTAVEVILEQVYTSKVAEKLTAAGDALRSELNRICEGSGAAVQVSGLGSMMNVHFAGGPLSSIADIAAVDADMRDLFYLHMLEQGLWLARRGMINLSTLTGAPEREKLLGVFHLFLSRYGSLLPRR